MDDCSSYDWDTTSCGHHEDAGVTCSYEASMNPTKPKYLPDDGDVRLLGGSTGNEGRVEVYWDYEWCSVCDDNWDVQDANVVCRQLGYPSASTAVVKSRFGYGNRMLLDEVNCKGNETSLLECDSNELFTHDCSTKEHAGVVCTPIITEPNNTVRLVGGPTFNSGRVEIYYDGTWRTVCDDYWNFKGAYVLCRQLGFAGVENFYSNAHFGLGSGPILHRLDCCGNDTQWTDCLASDWDTVICTHEEDAGLTCIYEEPTSLPYVVRLADGLTPNSGRVELYFDGLWRTVCDKYWDYNDASVICRQLGYIAADNVSFREYFGKGFGPILRSLECNGTESKWADCNVDDWDNTTCQHYQDVGVICKYKELLSHPSTVRLVDGSNSNSGRVELYYDGSWNTICDDAWDCYDAQVICRQLGFAGVENYAIHFEAGEGPILELIDCNGTEVQWTGCSLGGWNTFRCSHFEDAGVICRYKEPTNPLKTVRLAGNLDNSSGRVEIFFNGFWGTICGRDFDYEEANVVCRQLGFTGVDNLLSGVLMEGGSGPILRQLECIGTETQWTDCSLHDWDTNSCIHYEDAGMICSNNGKSFSPTPIAVIVAGAFIFLSI